MIMVQSYYVTLCRLSVRTVPGFPFCAASSRLAKLIRSASLVQRRAHFWSKAACSRKQLAP